MAYPPYSIDRGLPGYHGEAGRVPKYSKYGVACIHDPQCRQVFGQVSQEQQKCDVTDLGAYRSE